MLIILPSLALGLLCLILLGVQQPGERGDRFAPAGAFLGAMILWGTILVAIVEVLSLFSAIHMLSLATAWSLCIGLCWLYGKRKAYLRRGWRRMVRVLSDFGELTVIQRLIVGGLAAAMLVLLVIALLSPPNNVDSMIYHMSRVTHWAQNRSIRHFATANFGQNIKPIWAEVAILNLRVLWGSDRPANLIQWFSMVACLFGVAGLATLLGARRGGRILAIAFAASVPMGVMQATSTQNDYVAAMWLVALAYFVVLGKKKPLAMFESVLIGMTVGLGMLTKGTFYAYAGPLLIWSFLPRLFKESRLQGVAQGVIVAVIAIILNSGFWARNVTTYGGLFGAPGTLRGPLAIDEVISNEPGSTDETPQVNGPEAQPSIEDQGKEDSGNGDATSGSAINWLVHVVGTRVRWFLRRLAMNMAQNTVMPTSFLTSKSWALLGRAPALFDQGFLQSLREGMWNHEDTAGNLFHLIAALGAFLALGFLAGKRSEWRLPAIYGLVAFTGYSLLTLISYSVKLFGIRYQLPFFIMSAPALASLFRSRRVEIWSLILAAGFLLSAWPYVMLNNTRPLIGWRPKTRLGSVLTASQEDILFAMASGIKDEYVEVASQVRTSGCRRVGLDIDYNALEYYWWWLMEAPQSGIRIETLRPVPETQRYADPIFEPCAIICTNCGAVERMEGFSLQADLGHVKLYGQSNLGPRK